MRLLYGTTNKAKLAAMEQVMHSLGITLISLADLPGEIPVIRETGNTPLENAQIKARCYYDRYHMPVISCDSGLYFDELEESEQPGLHVRRVNGRRLSDDEMIAYYGSLAEKHGGKLTGRYRNAVCLVADGGKMYSSMDLSLATEPFLLVSKPHKKRVEGFPLDSLSKDMASGQYYYDLEQKEVSTSTEQGIRNFLAAVWKEGAFPGERCQGGNEETKKYESGGSGIEDKIAGKCKGRDREPAGGRL